ncbi:putative cytochrome P450 [Helianthus debilis subsp. tardiflorus]
MEPFSSLHTLLLSLFPSIGTIFVIFICVKWILFYSKNRKNTPPKLPIIGNFHQLGLSPNRNLQIWSQKYGPIMLFHLGSVPTLIASSANAAQEIMKTHDHSFCSRPSLTMPNILLYGCKGVLFSPHGEYWRQLKSVMVHKLLSNTRVKSYQKVRESEIDHMIRVLGESCGTTIDMGSIFVTLTNNIICRVALGRKFDGSKQIDLVKTLIYMLTVFDVGSYIPWLSWVDQVIGAKGRAEKIAKEFDEFLEGVIKEHVNKKRSEDAESEKAGEDFIDILLDLQEDKTNDFTLHRVSLKALILEAFVAGTDTIYSSLEWSMSELIRNPRVMKKLQQEVTEIAQGRSAISEDDLEKMPYLKAVLKESLQSSGPTSCSSRINARLIVNAWAIGRDHSLWEEANEFQPERFLDNSINYQSLQFGWIPFGAGRRSCPGMQFSVPVLELALANIIYKFDIGLPNGIKNEDLDMSEAFGILMHRKSSLLVRVTPRF